MLPSVVAAQCQLQNGQKLASYGLKMELSDATTWDIGIRSYIPIGLCVALGSKWHQQVRGWPDVLGAWGNLMLADESYGFNLLLKLQMGNCTSDWGIWSLAHTHRSE